LTHVSRSACYLLVEFAFEGVQRIFVALGFVFDVFHVRRHRSKIGNELFGFKEVLNVMLDFLRSREVAEMDAVIVHRVSLQDFVFTQHFLEILEILLQSYVLCIVVARVEFD